VKKKEIRDRNSQLSLRLLGTQEYTQDGLIRNSTEIFRIFKEQQLKIWKKGNIFLW